MLVWEYNWLSQVHWNILPILKMSKSYTNEIKLLKNWCWDYINTQIVLQIYKYKIKIPRSVGCLHYLIIYKYALLYRDHCMLIFTLNPWRAPWSFYFWMRGFDSSLYNTHSTRVGNQRTWPSAVSSACHTRNRALEKRVLFEIHLIC